MGVRRLARGRASSLASPLIRPNKKVGEISVCDPCHIGACPVPPSAQSGRAEQDEFSHPTRWDRAPQRVLPPHVCMRVFGFMLLMSGVRTLCVLFIFKEEPRAYDGTGHLTTQDADTFGAALPFPPLPTNPHIHSTYHPILPSFFYFFSLPSLWIFLA